MNRLFTFGCSFTNYMWPTWADILAIEFDSYQNWGRIGAGNHFIFYSLLECINRNEITADDTIAIMWTSVGREDRFLNFHWDTGGSVYNSKVGEEYITKLTDPAGYYLVNITLIDAARRLLDSIGCKYSFMSMIPLSTVDDSLKPKREQKVNNQFEQSVNIVYTDTLNRINRSMYEIIYKNDWYTKKDIIIPVAIQIATESLREHYNICKGNDWLNFDDAMGCADNKIPTNLIDEFDFISKRHEINTMRQDFHPIPIEHYNYLIALNIPLTLNQHNYAVEWNDKVLTDVNLKFEQHKVIRF